MIDNFRDIDYNIMRWHEERRREGLTPAQRLRKLETMEDAFEQLAFAMQDVMEMSGREAFKQECRRIWNLLNPILNRTKRVL